MNFVSAQVYDRNNMGYSQPMNFHIKPDHFRDMPLTPEPRRRHTMIGGGPMIDDNASDSNHLRPTFMHGANSVNSIPMNDLYKTNSARRLSHHSVGNHSAVKTNSHRHSLDQDEALPLLVPDDQQGMSGGTSEYLIPRCEESLSSDHNCRLEGCQRVVINVSGLRFETQLRTLDRLPNTLLGNPEKRRHYWDDAKQEFFFDRHRPTFQSILYYYQSGGRLKRPLEVPKDIFLNELHFYELGGSAIDSFKRNEGYLVEKAPPTGPQHKVLRKIWTTVEFPESSFVAKVFAILSVTFILISVVTFCVETLPELKGSSCKNATFVDADGEVVTRKVPNLTAPLFLAETCCIAWFVLELALRLISSPSKITFLRTAINWIDLVAIAPYFVFLILHFASGTCDSENKGSVLSVLRVLRVVRIFKLSKHSEGLKILGMTLKTSIRELSMFVLFLGIATIIFSGAIFYAELDHPDTQFSSIPDAFWWAIVSMTTVGYGDFVPMGLIGKIIGGVTVLSGVLAIALPVPVIVANFNNYYRHYTAGRPRNKSRDKRQGQFKTWCEHLLDFGPCRRCIPRCVTPDKNSQPY